MIVMTHAKHPKPIKRLYDSLCIGLLQQGAPKLRARGGMNKQQFSISSG